jgi:ribulose-phosphate 3-epimerase
MPARPPIAAPSILSADFSRLGEELAIADAERDWVHCDVMDHQFVPNLTFGPLIVAAARKLTRAWLDVHLMVEQPWLMVDDFRAAGADSISVHIEACRETREVLRQIRATGAKAGLAVKPNTPFAAVAPYLPDLDVFLVMTVEPGFGGQAFMPEMLEKVSAARAVREQKRLEFVIEVDGGIGEGTARTARAAGADVFVAGNAVFKASEPRAALAGLRAAIAG